MRSPHSIPAAVWLLGSVLAAAVSALDPFDHGVWLAAYLFLVGFAAQLLLARGQVALIAFMAVSALVGTALAWHTPWL